MLKLLHKYVCNYNKMLINIVRQMCIIDDFFYVGATEIDIYY